MPHRDRKRRYLTMALAASVALHVGMTALYVATRPDPPALLRVVVGGDGAGTVYSEPGGIRCGNDCLGHYEAGQTVRLVAVVAEGATWLGWGGECQAEEDYNLACSITVLGEHKVTASFGLMPQEVEVSFQDVAEDDDEDEFQVALPTVKQQRELIAKAPPLAEVLAPKTVPIEPKPLVPKLVPPEQKKQPEQPKEAYTMKSVEVPDQNEVEEAPDDARFLSDKNRDVAEETRARDTNLVKQQQGDVVASAESDVASDEIGAEDDEIAETEDSEATDFEARESDTAAAGEGAIARGQLPGDEGEAGRNGQAGDGAAAKSPGVLAMRGIEGRGAPGGPSEPEATGDLGGRAGAPGKRGRRGVKTDLSWDDFERIMGKENLDKQVALARQKRSAKKGRWERKLGAIRSSLENFNSEVRVGNQTALKTRAAPFAVYIARMHRRIHKLWGFGFLSDLDDLPASHELNDWTLWTKLEIIIDPQGEIEKVNIVKPSGVSMFDVAAIDALYTAGPFQAPPPDIRSPDGKIYIHWKFHRDWRQCGTFGAQPFILDKAPKSSGQGDQAGSSPLMPRIRRADMQELRKQAATQTKIVTDKMPSPKDAGAVHAANLWLGGYAQADVSKLVAVSDVPFSSAGTVVARNGPELRNVYRNILGEGRASIRDHKILTSAGVRRVFGSLPQGVAPSGDQVYLVVRTGGGRMIVALKRSTSGEYRVVGFHR